MVLDGVLADEQLRGDVARLFSPRATSLSTSSSRSVSRGAGTCCRSSLRFIIVANSVRSLAAIDGLISDWPPATDADRGARPLRSRSP